MAMKTNKYIYRIPWAENVLDRASLISFKHTKLKDMTL